MYNNNHINDGLTMLRPPNDLPPRGSSGLSAGSPVNMSRVSPLGILGMTLMVCALISALFLLAPPLCILVYVSFPLMGLALITLLEIANRTSSPAQRGMGGGGWAKDWEYWSRGWYQGAKATTPNMLQAVLLPWLKYTYSTEGLRMLLFINGAILAAGLLVAGLVVGAHYFQCCRAPAR